MKQSAFGVIFLSLILQVLGLPSDGRHPVYNIAHMVNSIPEIDKYLSRGANAIEADVKLTKSGLVDFTYHGYPCDCFRLCNRKEDFATYISYVRNITIPGSEKYKENFTLLFLDIKSSSLAPQFKYGAGKNLANDLIKYLWNGGDDLTPINVLICIGHTSDSDIIRGLQETLKTRNLDHLFAKIGFDVGLNDDPKAIANMWRSLGIKNNIWQGDGITNCLAPFRSRKRIRGLMEMINNGGGYMCKVYQWTIDYTLAFRISLRLGVDTFITNFPERLNSVIHDSGVRQRYRLATINDNPWESLPVYPSVATDFITTVPIAKIMYSVAEEVMDSMITFVGEIAGINFIRGNHVPDYLPLMNAIVNADRSEPEVPDSEIYCQYTLCTLFTLYNNESTSHRLRLDSDCMRANNTPGSEIWSVCTSIKRLLFQ